MLWIIGGFLTFCGLSVFLEFGLAIPRSGGEKNYLERVYRHPKYLATCVLASQMILLGFSSGNSLAFGRYILFASGRETPDGWEARGIAVACVTFSVLLHSTLPKWGIRLFNVLGVFKVVILLFIVFSGFAALAGHRRVPDPHNFDNAFRIEDGDGYGGGGAYAYSNALLNIIYSYKGWENANYVLGELKSPRKTLAVAAPIAIGGVTILYVLANVAYFAAIPKSDLAKSEVIVAGLFFRNIFGQGAAARSLPAFVALSNLGNVLAVSFAHARVNQELAKEGMLPFSRFWASNRPFNSPAASVSLFIQSLSNMANECSCFSIGLSLLLCCLHHLLDQLTTLSSTCMFSLLGIIDYMLTDSGTPTPVLGSTASSPPVLSISTGVNPKTGLHHGTHTFPSRSFTSWQTSSSLSCLLFHLMVTGTLMDIRTMFSLLSVLEF
jgi:amino acid transporter